MTAPEKLRFQDRLKQRQQSIGVRPMSKFRDDRGFRRLETLKILQRLTPTASYVIVFDPPAVDPLTDHLA
jgi:hypothetical protein